MEHTDYFELYRGYLFGISYRILGSAMDAEDVLQDAFLRWQAIPLEQIEEPKAFLAKVVTRLSIDQLRSASRQREQYIGTWLPEPLVTSSHGALSENAIQRETISIALLHLMEQLSPEQRAAFVLREAFDYEYAEIADVIDKSPENCRQLVSRARRQLDREHPRMPTPPQASLEMVQRLLQSVTTGDIATLEKLLAEDIVHYSDGNGLRGVARKPVVGRYQVIKFFNGLQRTAPEDANIRLVELNESPAILFMQGARPFAAMFFNIIEGRVRSTYSVANPDKLRALGLSV